MTNVGLNCHIHDMIDKFSPISISVFITIKF